MLYQTRFTLVILIFGAAFINQGLAYPCTERKNQIKCPSRESCILFSSICDGKKDCPLAEDEEESFCEAYKNSCPRGEFKCPDSLSSCYPYLELCEDWTCSTYINQTICDALLTRRLPMKPTKIPIKPSDASISEEDLEAFLRLVNGSSTITNQCPMFYTNVSGICLSFLPFKLSWAEASESCTSISGVLLKSEDMVFMNTVRYLNEKGYASDFWIGGMFDIVFEKWLWHNKGPMPMGTPYWSMTYKSLCETRQINEKLGKSEGCYHYHHAPTVSSAGQCASMDYKNLFYFSNADCSKKKKPICLYDGPSKSTN